MNSMLTKEELKKIDKMREELQILKNRIKKLESKPRQILADSVSGSGFNYPYIKHSIVVEGLDESTTYRKLKTYVSKLKKMYIEKVCKLEKEIIHIEYELNNISDPEIREIIRFKYEQGLNWIQIMHRRGDNSEDAARKMLDRFLEKK